MSTLFDFLRTAARIVVGAFLFCFGIASMLQIASGRGLDLPPNAHPGEVHGAIFGAIILPLIVGIVGFKMMTRRNLPRESS